MKGDEEGPGGDSQHWVTGFEMVFSKVHVDIFLDSIMADGYKCQPSLSEISWSSEGGQTDRYANKHCFYGHLNTRCRLEY